MRRTLLWAGVASTALFAAFTAVGAVVLLLRQENGFAQHLFSAHRGEIASLLARIFVAEIALSLAYAAWLQPLLAGRRAVASVALLWAGSLLFALTRSTHPLFGSLHRMAVAVADALPASLREAWDPRWSWAVPGVPAAWALIVRLRSARARRRLALAGCAATVLAALARVPGSGGPAGPSPDGRGEGRPNVVLLAADSLRADRLGAYGHNRPTSPSIDALAERGILFEDVLVPTASTHESWVSTFSSLEPHEHGLRHMFPSRAKLAEVERRCRFLPQLLREAGWATSVVGGWCGATFELFDFGFERVDVTNAQKASSLLAEGLLLCHLALWPFADKPFGRMVLPEAGRVSFARPPRRITDRALAEIDRLAKTGRPFFLLVVHDVTHLPYAADWPYPKLFSRPDYCGRHRFRIDVDVDRMIQQGFAHDLNGEEIAHVRDLYDGCVRSFDDEVGRVVEHLARRGLLAETIVGVLSDHGDDLYEPGATLGHGVTLFGGDQANRIPAVFAGPGVPRGRRVGGIARSIDLAPTLLGWLGIEPPPEWSGIDLSTGRRPEAALLETSYLLYRQPVPDLREGEEPLPFPRVDRAVFCDHSFDGNLVLDPSLEDDVVRTKSFAVRRGPWKLVVVPGRDRPIVRLFDLAADPHMERDLSVVRRDVAEALAALLPDGVMRPVGAGH